MLVSTTRHSVSSIRKRERERRLERTNGKKEFSTHFSETDGEVSGEIVSCREFGEVVVETPVGGDSEGTTLSNTSTESFSEPLYFLL